MDLLSIALILLVAWIATIVVAVALARAAGRADARADAEVRSLAVHPDLTREPSGERAALEALADEVMRTNARAARPEPASERPPADQSRPAPRRLKRRSRFTARRERIKNLPL